MRIFITLVAYSFLSSCSVKLSAVHQNFDKFSEDVTFCLNKACKSDNSSFFNNLFIISPVLAYGGGGGGGGAGGGLNADKNKISYETFNICLKNKGYVKDDDGIFVLPFLQCK